MDYAHLKPTKWIKDFLDLMDKVNTNILWQDSYYARKMKREIGII